MSDNSKKKTIEPEDSGLYSSAEQERLEANHAMRDEVTRDVYATIKNKKKDNKDIGREARLLKELIDSSDASTHKLAENRTKFKSAEAEGSLADTTAALLIEISRSTTKSSETPDKPRMLELDDSVMDIEVVKGEMDIATTDFTIEDFTSPEKEV